MPDIKADDGCTIHVEVEGPERAPVLMLSNSLGTDLHMWDDQVRGITRHFRLVRYDRRGHGKSDVPKGPYTMERLGRDVLARARRARHRQDQLVRAVDGRHGRHVARRQCAEPHRQAHPLQHIRLFPRQDDLGRPHQDRAREGLGRHRRCATWSAGSPRTSANARRKRWRGSARCSSPPISRAISAAAKRSATWIIARCLPKINAPTLVIAGRHDPATTLEAGEYINEHMPGARIAVLDAAHIANLEQPQIYADTVLGFLLG